MVFAAVILVVLVAKERETIYKRNEEYSREVVAFEDGNVHKIDIMLRLILPLSSFQTGMQIFSLTCTRKPNPLTVWSGMEWWATLIICPSLNEGGMGFVKKFMQTEGNSPQTT